MKKLVMSFMFLVLAGSVFALQPYNTNLLVNPGFEEATVSPWGTVGPSSSVAIDSDAYSGLQSLRASTPSGPYGTYQYVPGFTEEDRYEDYRVSFWYRLKDQQATHKEFRFIWYERCVITNRITKPGPTLTATSEWQYYSDVFTLTGGTDPADYTNRVDWTIRVETVGPDLIFDDAVFYKLTPEPTLVAPAPNGVSNVDLSTTLEWAPADVSAWPSPLDPNNFAVRTNQYLYFQADSDDFTDVEPITLASDVNDFSVGPLDMSTTYYWAIDTGIDGSGPRRFSDPNANDSNTLWMPFPWYFTTKTPAPFIDVYDNVVTTTALLPVVLSATITDLDNNLATVVFSATDPNVTLQNLDLTDLYHPTIEVVTAQQGTYTITLTVTDTSDNAAIDTAYVAVYDDACQAAQAASSWTGFNNLDRSDPRDCKVDLADFAAMAAEWLNDKTLKSQETF